jgi:hypothetical protein
MDKDRFNMLAVFEGKATRSPYVGLYHFGDKGTFWVQLAEPLPIQSQMRFTVYGKRNKNQPIEPFRLKARFLDKLGNEIASTPMVDYGTRVPGEGEWFKYLDGVAGLAGPLPVQWNVPKGTKVIEFQAYAESDTRRHLVGYLGQLVLFQDLLAGELPPISRER